MNCTSDGECIWRRGSQRYRVARVFLLACTIRTLIRVYEKTDENYANKNRIVVFSMSFSHFIYLSIAIHTYVYIIHVCIYALARSFLNVKSVL